MFGNVGVEAERKETAMTALEALERARQLARRDIQLLDEVIERKQGDGSVEPRHYADLACLVSERRGLVRGMSSIGIVAEVVNSQEGKS